MSSFGMEDTVVSTSGKDFWITNRRKLVTMLAIVLPLVITSSYMYLTTPDASTEAMMFFKGRPLASFLPLTGSKNTSIFDSNANGNDTEGESNFEDIGNTTDSLGTQPVEESIDTEVESNFEDTGNTTDSLGIQPVEESIDTEVESNFEDAGNTTLNLGTQPVEESIDTEVESNFEDTGNATDSLGTQPVVESIDTEGESNFEDAGNTTLNLGTQPVEESIDTEVESNFEDAGNTTLNLGTQPVAESIDTEVESNFEDTGNATDSLGTQPVEESIEPGAVAENEDPISETATSVNKTSPALGFPNQELANVTISDSLKNLTSTNVNASTDASKQKIPDDISSSHQQTEQTIIAMEGQGLSNVTSKGVCDLLKGRWVPDTRQPAYTNATCNSIQEAQNCMKNGRSDTGYLYWKWQPEQCDLPRIDHRAFLTAMRNRHMAFVGDSIARNQFQSLLCLLSQSEQPENTYTAPGDKDKVFVFPSYNFTMAVYWSPYLVHVEYKQITLPNNATETVVDAHLDKLDEALVARMPGVDILHISTGQWWFKFAYYLQNGQTIGCHTWPGWPECNDIGFADPYRMAIHNILRGVISIPGFIGTTVFRSFSPDHFEGGSWSNNGQCVRTEPGGVPISDMIRTMHKVQIEVFQNVTGALSASEKHRLWLLDITNLSQERPDGHPNAYRTPYPFSDKTKGQRIQKDCLHWCLPGPIDTWNDLLVETLHDAVYH